MTRRPGRCPASPLLVMGAIHTIAGASLYKTPAERPALYAAAALVLAAVAAWWLPLIRTDHNLAPM